VSADAGASGRAGAICGSATVASALAAASAHAGASGQAGTVRGPAAVAIALAAALLCPAIASAQAAVGVRHGTGEGSANYNVGDIHARIRAAGPIYLPAGAQTLGGAWACVADSNATCAYDGSALSLGGAAALVDRARGLLTFGADVGTFVRRGSFASNRYAGNRHLTASVGAERELTVFGPLGCSAASRTDTSSTTNIAAPAAPRRT
jgi:hypothetical protein